MLIRRPRRWEIPESAITAPQVYFDRRRFIGGVGSAAVAMLGSRGLWAAPTGAEKATPTAAPSVARDPRFSLDRAITVEQVAATHNIFDEFSSDHERVWQLARNFRVHPWRVQIGGAVEKQQAFDVDELTRRLGVEERLYRHRCVETWAMAVPWTGIPLKKLIDLAKPLGKAKYLRMISAARPEEMPGWYASKRVFPYYEALSLAEATNELAFLATGIYGHPLPPQHGAPLRLVVPWKYGLKGIKSIVAFEFTEERPGTFWNDLSPSNYSFLCNVDPTTTAPWSQAQEEMLGTGEKRPTLPWNGYGEWVAALYA